MLVPWLAEVPVHYWGGIDTHGVAILDQLRGFIPRAVSLMMDHDTLMAHRGFWGREEQPTRRDLPRLTAAEFAVFNDLATTGFSPPAFRTRTHPFRLGTCGCRGPTVP